MGGAAHRSSFAVSMIIAAPKPSQMSLHKWTVELRAALAAYRRRRQQEAEGILYMINDLLYKNGVTLVRCVRHLYVGDGIGSDANAFT